MSWFNRLFRNRKSEAENANRQIPAGAYCGAFPLPTGDDPPEWLHIVPIGEFPFHHDGPHAVTAETVAQMVGNFKRHSIDILVDIDHNSIWGSTGAAGWITDVEARDDGLYVRYPEFTPSALESIANREYRYFSPVYYLGSEDKQGNQIGARLDSVALTNRPYFDEHEIDPVGNSADLDLSNAADSPSSTPAQDDTTVMDRDTLISELGLKAEATDEEINTAFANMKTSAAEKKPDPPADPTDDAPDDNTDGDDTVESLAEKVNSLATRLDERDAAGEKARISSLVDGAIADRKILPRDKETYLRSASADFDATKKTLGAIKNNTVAPDSVTVSDGSKPQESDSRFVASRDTGMMKYVNEQQGV